MDRCLVIKKKKENKSKERNERPMGMNERKRARVGTPELIVAEERRREMSLIPHERLVVVC